MSTGFLIDTCIWIDVERGSLAPGDVALFTGDAPVFLSPVTLAELRYGAEVATDPAIRQRRLAAIRRLQSRPLLPIDGGTGEMFGTLAAQVALAGGSHSYRVQDLWLASQAIQHGLRLLTRHRRDFADLSGLDLVVC
ncbi:MAG: type II toxin-antitoxin system VapC family toxin [Actinobacteria bacterium]|nr:type II toxin-antitoxin system VapC family toxin [Actinomycetota bacterium]